MDDSQNTTLAGQMCVRELEFSPGMQKYNKENPGIAFERKAAKVNLLF